MKIIVVAQGKGGVGKTTTAAHIAFHAAEAGLKVLAVDLDTGNLSVTLRDHRLEIPASRLFGDGQINLPQWESVPSLALVPADPALANLIYMPLDQAQQKLPGNLAAFALYFDLCVIDTAPGISIAVAAALNAADAVISPAEMESYSIEGIKDMIRVILNVRKSNSKLKFLGIVPSRVDRRDPRQVKHLEQLQETSSQFLAPITIHKRTTIADALARGEPVWKSRKTTARAAAVEMRALGEYVLNKMEIKR